MIGGLAVGRVKIRPGGFEVRRFLAREAIHLLEERNEVVAGDRADSGNNWSLLEAIGDTISDKQRSGFDASGGIEPRLAAWR